MSQRKINKSKVSSSFKFKSKIIIHEVHNNDVIYLLEKLYFLFLWSEHHSEVKMVPSFRRKKTKCFFLETFAFEMCYHDLQCIDFNNVHSTKEIMKMYFFFHLFQLKEKKHSLNLLEFMLAWHSSILISNRGNWGDNCKYTDFLFLNCVSYSFPSNFFYAISDFCIFFCTRRQYMQTNDTGEWDMIQ